MLRVSDYPALYNMLQEPVVASLDCGAKCSQWNNGKPVCCTTKDGVQDAIPIVYDTEWEHLKDKLDLEGNLKWKPWIPVTKADKKLALPIVPDENLVECTGPSKCKRENRSLVCRTFPFQPFFIESRFIGLSHYPVYDQACWVLMNDHRVNPRFVAEYERYWLTVFQLYPLEQIAYMETSEDNRAHYSKRDLRAPVIPFPSCGLTEKQAFNLNLKLVELAAD